MGEIRTESITKCKLENGKILRYDRCSSNSELKEENENIKSIAYLGKGKIFSINNEEVKNSKTYHFWKVTYKC